MSGVRRLAAAAAVMVVTLGACGGGDDATDSSADGGTADANVFDEVGEAADEFESGAASFEVVDAPTVTAPAGTAVVDVDGQRLEYPMAGAIALVCDVDPGFVQVNIQTPEGYSMSLVASTNTGSWIGSLTAVGDDSNVAYGSSFEGGRLGIGENAVSYEGPIDKVVDRDILNPQTLQGTVAVNCESPGGDPSASLDGETITFPVSGAQSFECEVASDAFEIRVNRLAIDGTQLEMQGRDDGSQWIGAIVVYTSEGNWTATLPTDGSGLLVDGGTVSFEGTFIAPDGGEIQGSATATCF